MHQDSIFREGYQPPAPSYLRYLRPKEEARPWIMNFVVWIVTALLMLLISQVAASFIL